MIAISWVGRREAGEFLSLFLIAVFFRRKRRRAFLETQRDVASCASRGKSSMLWKIRERGVSMAHAASYFNYKIFPATSRLTSFLLVRKFFQPKFANLKCNSTNRETFVTSRVLVRNFSFVKHENTSTTHILNVVYSPNILVSADTKRTKLPSPRRWRTCYKFLRGSSVGTCKYHQDSKHI